MDLERRDYAEATDKLERAAAIHERFFAEDPYPYVSILLNLAEARTSAGQYEQAQAGLDRVEQVLAGIAEDLPKARNARAQLLKIRAWLLSDWKGDHDGAETLMIEAVELSREPDRPAAVAKMLSNLASVQAARGKLQEALASYEEVVELVRESHGADAIETATVLENAANVYFRMNKYDEALTRLSEVLAIRKRVFGEDSFMAARTGFNMAVVALRTGDSKRAVAEIDRVLPIFQKQLGGENPEMSALWRHRAECHLALGNAAMALADAERAATILEPRHPPTHPNRLRCMQVRAEVLRALGRDAEAKHLVNESLAQLDAGNPDQAKWIEKLRAMLESDAGDGAASQPATSSAPAAP
jgi:tetratricopeptide (TPR) repeat protein